MRGIDKEKRHEALSLPADTASLDKVEDVLVLLIQLRDRILLLADFAEAKLDAILEEADTSFICVQGN